MFLDVPLGHTTGGPNDPETQRRILTEGLTAGAAIESPGSFVELPYRWRDDDWKVDPLSWSRRRQESGRSGRSSGGDTRTGRTDNPVYQSEDDRTAAEAMDFEQQCRSCLGLAVS